MLLGCLKLTASVSLTIIKQYSIVAKHVNIAS